MKTHLNKPCQSYTLSTVTYHGATIRKMEAQLLSQKLFLGGKRILLHVLWNDSEVTDSQKTDDASYRQQNVNPFFVR